MAKKALSHLNCFLVNETFSRIFLQNTYLPYLKQYSLLESPEQENYHLRLSLKSVKSAPKLLFVKKEGNT